MSIVKMKRIRLIALAKDKDALLSSLLHVGCVELKEPAELLADEAYASLLHREGSAAAQAKALLAQAEAAGQEKTRQTLAEYAADCQALKERSQAKLDQAAKVIVGTVVRG